MRLNQYISLVMFDKTFLFPGTDRKTDKSTYSNDCVHSKDRG